MELELGKKKVKLTLKLGEKVYDLVGLNVGQLMDLSDADMKKDGIKSVVKLLAELGLPEDESKKMDLEDLVLLQTKLLESPEKK